MLIKPESTHKPGQTDVLKTVSVWPVLILIALDSVINKQKNITVRSMTPNIGYYLAIK